jgi:membrane-associated phospholipid phosphatase
LLAAVLFYYSHTFGKEDFFLLLNKNEGSVADKLFYIFTFGGDALIWIPVLIIVIFLLKRKDAIVLLVAAFALSTIFVQGIKNLVPEDRPIKAITNTSLIHTVEGVEVHTINSFPSGHSTTAFCIYFVLTTFL